MLTAALATHLDTIGLGVHGRDGADVFLEDLPHTPENAVGVYAQPGRKVGRFRRPGVQIIVRADGTGGRARAGYERAQDILEALDGTSHLAWGDGSGDAVRVAWCEALQAQPLSLGDDDNGRPRWSVRFDVELAGEVS